MRALVTGGAGFIGSHLVERLLDEGYDVCVVDNMSTGHREFLPAGGFDLVEADLTDTSQDFRPIFDGVDVVYHLAGNADVRYGWGHPRKDLEYNTIATIRVAELAARAKVQEFVFSSTGSIYGEASVIPTPEAAPIPNQTSLYGASKFAAESFLAAYSAKNLFDVYIFRFVSVLGPRYTHGHVVDFVRQLQANPTALHILGNGLQRKSYMHVADCIEGILKIRPPMNSRVGKFQVFNLGTTDTCTVLESAGWICDEMGLNPSFMTGTEIQGWIGDNPIIFLDTAKAGRAGWLPRTSIENAVRETTRWLIDNPQYTGIHEINLS